MTAAPKGELREISMALIDEPTNAMRSTMDDDELASLAHSIATTGLINPISVRPRGARFEIIAGHQRYVACIAARLLVVPCRVFDLDDRELERMKVAENKERSDVNAADEAEYFERLLAQHCHDDVDELAQFVEQPRTYVESRLLLKLGDPDVFQAVKQNEIGIGVATELNRYKNDAWRRVHLESAKRGATVREVRKWRVDAENFETRQAEGQSGATESATAPTTPAYNLPVCQVCEKQDEPHRLINVPVHDYCYQAILKRLLESYHGA